MIVLLRDRKEATSDIYFITLPRPVQRGTENGRLGQR
jgi:hypothetical protein